MTEGGFTREELRKIDALVSLFVMEYPTLTNPVQGGSQDPNALEHLPSSQNYPPWSCDEALALTVVRYMVDEGFVATLTQRPEGGWTVCLSYGRGVEIIEHRAVSRLLSLAVCLASLQAVGISRLPT